MPHVQLMMAAGGNFYLNLMKNSPAWPSFYLSYCNHFYTIPWPPSPTIDTKTDKGIYLLQTWFDVVPVSRQALLPEVAFVWLTLRNIGDPHLRVQLYKCWAMLSIVDQNVGWLGEAMLVSSACILHIWKLGFLPHFFYHQLNCYLYNWEQEIARVEIFYYWNWDLSFSFWEKIMPLAMICKLCYNTIFLIDSTEC